MTDFFKQIFSAFSQRIKSPILGYILIAFLILNWKSIFLMVFSDSPILFRFMYVEFNANIWTSYILPVLFGVGAALIGPWVALWAATWTEKPVTKKKFLELKAANKLKTEELRLAEVKNEEVDSEIQRTLQDIQAKQINDVEARKALEGKIDSIRNNNPSQEAAISTQDHINREDLRRKCDTANLLRGDLSNRDKAIQRGFQDDLFENTVKMRRLVSSKVGLDNSARQRLLSDLTEIEEFAINGKLVDATKKFQQFKKNQKIIMSSNSLEMMP